MQNCEDVLMSLSIWIVSESVLRDENRDSQVVFVVS